MKREEFSPRSDLESSEGVTDEALMERVVDGDDKAFEVLFGRYADPLHGYLLRFSGSSSTADDLVQATFLSVVRSRNRFRRGARVKPWLYAIATNAARDWRRRGKGERLTAPEDLPEAPVRGEAESVDPGLQRSVREALSQLPDGQREAILMHRFEGLTFGEIAEALGQKETAIRVRAHRGYERLRGLLAPLGEDL